MIFCSCREKADEVTLVIPLVDLCDRVRIWLRARHHLRMLIVNMLADDPVNVDDEDLSQNETRTLNSCGVLRMFLIVRSEQSDCIRAL